MGSLTAEEPSVHALVQGRRVWYLINHALVPVPFWGLRWLYCPCFHGLLLQRIGKAREVTFYVIRQAWCQLERPNAPCAWWHGGAGSETRLRYAVRLSEAEMAAMDTSPDPLSVARTSLNSCGTTARGSGRRKRARAISHGA